MIRRYYKILFILIICIIIIFIVLITMLIYNAINPFSNENASVSKSTWSAIFLPLSAILVLLLFISGLIISRYEYYKNIIKDERTHNNTTINIT